jgi:uncharacterized protein YgbK (DUF1537 family)
LKNQQTPKSQLLSRLPDEWPHDLRPAIQKQVHADRRKIVVLDDDPTGTQTIHGLPVITEWSVDTLAAELNNNLPAFYILTNSRSYPLPIARQMNAEIGHNLTAAAAQAHREFVVISRSDSTLRGHFPGEVEALSHALEQNYDGWIINPFFLEGGRYTIDDVHYVDEGDELVPAGEPIEQHQVRMSNGPAIVSMLGKHGFANCGRCPPESCEAMPRQCPQS